MPSGGSTLLLPSDQKSAKKKRESQSKKEKKRARSTFETRPATVPRGFSFSWKWWNQKRKKKATKYGERGNECFFLHPTKQPTRSGQWTLSSSYDFSAAASCYKSDHPRYENDTAEREINYTVRCTVWSSHESQRPKHLFIQKCCHYVGDNTQTPSGNGQEIFLFLFTSLQGYPVIWLAVRYGVHLAQRNQIRETGFRQHTGALLLAHTPDADQLLLPREEDLMWPQMFLYYYYWPHDSVISLPVFLTWLKLLAPS